jgi:predicted 3-demethylubiquinone-9 3-methyltransferase (glyoxalase superfamily)
MPVATQKLQPRLWFDTQAEAAAKHFRPLMAGRSDRRTRLLADEKSEKAQRVMKALLQMKKLDIAALKSRVKRVNSSITSHNNSPTPHME